MKSDETKNRIIEATIRLIKENNGNVSDITIRKICAEANIGTGLINHYFGSKYKLIEVCVQTIINNVVTTFKPRLTEGDRLDILRDNVKAVMDFLIENKEISRISILGDMSSPETDDNTMKTAGRFCRTIGGGNDALVSGFMLASLLQAFFLRRDLIEKNFGIDFYNKEQRDKLIDFMVERVAIL